MNAIMPINKIQCPKCRSENVEAIEYSDTVDFRNMELDVENLQMSKCRSCEHTWATKAQHAHNHAVTRETYGVVRDELRAKHGLLAGDEIAQIREVFGLNQREAASVFGGGYNAFNKYESGEVLQSFAMDRLLRLTKAVGAPAVEFLRNVFSAPNFIVISSSGTISRITVHIEDREYVPNLVLGTVRQLENYEPAHSWNLSGQAHTPLPIENHL